MGLRVSFLLMLGMALLSGCRADRVVRKTDLPASERKATLSTYEPPEALEHILEWYPGDWRAQLLLGLTDTSWEGKIKALRRADSLRPGEILVAYYLALAYLGSGDPDEEKRAGPYVDKALALDSGNGVLRVMQAYAFLKSNQLPQARALFLDARKLPGGDFYFERLEQAVMGLFSHGRYLNAYTLTEAVALYRKVPLPPFEKMIDILYSVFLDPLPERPYDIRIRGRDAAEGLFQLGGRLRVSSYSGPKLLSGGYEPRALGFMFQLKAAEFLTLFHRNFGDTAKSHRSFDELVAVQKEYEGFMASGAWGDSLVTGYLNGWSDLIKNQPSLELGRAVEVAEAWELWKKARVYRYPREDDTP